MPRRPSTCRAHAVARRDRPKSFGFAKSFSLASATVSDRAHFYLLLLSEDDGLNCPMCHTAGASLDPVTASLCRDRTLFFQSAPPRQKRSSLHLNVFYCVKLKDFETIFLQIGNGNVGAQVFPSGLSFPALC
jgi:hypothetical protein